jgi:hypothetical protein
MKTLFALLIGFTISALVNAEDIEVYLCDSKNADIEWGEGGDEDNTTYLTFFRLGKKVGVLKVDDFQTFFKEAKEYDRSSDPFSVPDSSAFSKTPKAITTLHISSIRRVTRRSPASGWRSVSFEPLEIYPMYLKDLRTEGNARHLLTKIF